MKLNEKKYIIQYLFGERGLLALIIFRLMSFHVTLLKLQKVII